MNVLAPTMVFAGDFWHGASGRSIVDGFRAIGWGTQERDLGYYLALTCGRVDLKIIRRLTRRSYIKAYQNAVMNDCVTLKPTVFMTIKGMHINRDMLHRVRDLGIKTAIFYPDVYFKHPGVDESTFDDYDYFFTAKAFHIPYFATRLRHARVHLMPHGFGSGVHRPFWPHIDEEDMRTDVVYIGTYSAYKFEWLSKVRALLPNIKLQIIGDGWTVPAHGTNLEASITGRAETGFAYSRAIQSSRINLAVHFGTVAGSGGWADAVSTRTFQIPAAKGFMLHVDNPEIRALFEPGKEIDVFTTPEELAAKIEFYLARPALRAEMIERAYARCVPAYSYDERAKEMSEIMLG